MFLQPTNKAFCNNPGGIYIILNVREKHGSVEQGLNYESLRQEIRQKLLDLVEPESQSKIIKKVYFGEELYASDKGKKQIIQTNTQSPTYRRYPDLIAIPFDGYDLKGNLWRENLFEKTVFNGMHTFDDAFILLRNGVLPVKRFSIAEITSIINKILKVDNLNSVTDI